MWPPGEPAQRESNVDYVLFDSIELLPRGQIKRTRDRD